MRAYWCALTAIAVSVAAPRVAFAQTQDSVQTLRQEIDQLKKDFETVRQQYGERLTALETQLSAIQGRPAEPAPPPAAPTSAQTPAPATAPVPTGAEGAGGPGGTLPVYGA